MVGFPLGPARWLKLQPPDTQWAALTVTEAASTESPLFLVLPGDSRPSLVFARGKELMAASFDGSAISTHVLATAPMDLPWHGLGYGDVDGDGRRDFVTTVGVFLVLAVPRARGGGSHG